MARSLTNKLDLTVIVQSMNHKEATTLYEQLRDYERRTARTDPHKAKVYNANALVVCQYLVLKAKGLI